MCMPLIAGKVLVYNLLIKKISNYAKQACQQVHELHSWSTLSRFNSSVEPFLIRNCVNLTPRFLKFPRTMTYIVETDVEMTRTGHTDVASRRTIGADWSRLTRTKIAIDAASRRINVTRRWTDVENRRSNVCDVVTLKFTDVDWRCTDFYLTFFYTLTANYMHLLWS
jgi:hypothetical protein